MTATVVAPAVPWAAATPERAVAEVRVALLGTGAVGTAFLQRLQDVRRWPRRACRSYTWRTRGAR